MDRGLQERLRTAARGGRVERSAFLDAAASSRLGSELRRDGVGVTVGGGYPGAERRVVVAHPEQIPAPLPRFVALFFPVEAAAVDDALARSGVDADALGDRIEHREGVSVVVVDPPPARLLEVALDVEVVPVERASAGSVRTVDLIVPALRADALGAKAFRVSRSYFAKGIAAGNVYRNGEPIAKGGTLASGDELFADGLGWMRLGDLSGATRRGNLRVTVEVERRG